MEKTPKITSTFASRNLVTIVMVPTIIVLHLGWMVLQKNRSLVKEHEEIDLPVITFYKYCLSKFGIRESTAKVADVKAKNP